MGRSTRPRRNQLVREAVASGYQAGQEEGLVGVLLDSDVIIEILRGRSRVVEAASILEGGAVPTYVTPIAVAEVQAGLRAGEQHLTDAFFEARGEVILDSKIAKRAGAYLQRYARSHGVEIADAFVAAAAAISGLGLWTLNRKNYPMGDVTFYEP
jgi:predicted nucleic acid-binding protein